MAGQQTTVFELRVSQPDVGKVIGKQGAGQPSRSAPFWGLLE